ncbi:hypothetical protein [Aquimarina algiphila]|uniref:hypothetical protein n=1 Tax=Aquimarina algiphila TaxID=2047982 RepID=UPI00232DB249|nr:hypothetical protein [Aquimarina algiphila]
MKTFLFCTCYMDNNDIHNNKTRINRWIEYYKEKMKLFGADYLFLIDDGSPLVDLSPYIDVIDSDKLPEFLISNINFVRFKDNLGRPTWEDYQGWWRSFVFSLNIAENYGFDKIIHIESDFYVLSKSMIEYMKLLKFGWVTFYSEYHNFPETAIQIICKDSYFKFKEIQTNIRNNNYRTENRISAELFLPFTTIERKFNGDRLGQPEVFDFWLKTKKNNQKLDYIGQVHPYHKSEYYKMFFESDYNI